MRNSLQFRMVLAAAVAVGFSAAAQAQGDSQKRAPRAERQKPASNSHKVWTNDDLGSVRRPADIYVDAKYTQAAETDGSKQSAAAKPAKHVAAPALSNPKTVEDADKMIAWEKRDVDAQTEFVEQLKKQIEEAPPEDKERLKKLLQERIQILADTRAEMETLVGQKKELQKKPAADGNTAAAQASSQ
jgi:hypothetical protein